MFNAASSGNAAAPPSNYIQPTLNHGLRIWWAYYWPTNVIATILVFCSAFWARKLYEDGIFSVRETVWTLRILPYFATYLVALFVIRYILSKKFRHFRIGLLPRTGSSDDSALRPTWKRAVRVWWTFSWRSVLYVVILSVAASVSLGMFMRFLSEMGRAMAILVPLLESLVISGAVGLFVIYSNILDEDFGDFRVVLLPREPSPKAAAAAPPAISPATP
ncbi:MAG TPA: hypothetical protein VJN69_02895 [Candidatus Acidoferrales bacterium]|nr:hypothetical protein [Candidatus Acidoferrales bacterium]